METKQKLPVLYHYDTRGNLDPVSRKSVLTNCMTAVKQSIVGSKQHFSCWIVHYRATVVGSNKFWKPESTINLTFKGGRLYGSMDSNILKVIIETFYLDWIKGWPLQLIKVNKTLWAMVLSGKITNPEQLAKKFSKLYFKGVYSYAALKCYYNMRAPMVGSLWDIYYHTTNPNLYILKFSDILKEDYDYGCGIDTLLRDTLLYCKFENSKLNPLWSTHRIAKEHQKQIERDNLSKLLEHDDTPIATPFSSEGFKPILTEREAFLESQIMSNCVYSCYWSSIKNGTYIVVTGEFEGKRIDIGIDIDSQLLNSIVCPFYLSQVHTAYNGSVSDNCRCFVSRWIERNKENLRTMIKEIRKDTSISEERELGILPF